MYTKIRTCHDILKSSIQIEPLIDFLRKQEVSIIGITNSNMNGYLTYMREFQAAGIKAVFGLNLQLPAGSVTVYPYNERGYHHLLKLSSQKDVGIEDLERFKEGLHFVVEANNHPQWIEKLSSLQISLLLGIQRDSQEEENLTKWNLPLIVTHEALYLQKEDAFAFKVARAIASGNPIDTKLPFPEQKHLPSKEEMKQLYSSTLLVDTTKFLENCLSYIPKYEAKMPFFPVPTEEDSATYLRRIAYEGLSIRKIPRDKQTLYYERLEYELNVICNMRYEDYFLIVADFIAFARKQEIMIGPARGSSASSLVAYALQITQVDPMQFDLLFERFLNPARVSLPDIDIDIIDTRRQEVIQYVVAKYGKEHVTQINTFGSLTAKAVARDVGRMFRFGSSTLEKISNMISETQESSLSAVYKVSKKFQSFIQENQEHQLWFDTCCRLEGQPRNESTHSAGIILSPMPFTEVAPISRESDGINCSQWTMNELESIGLLKIDFLGLKNLGLIEAIKASIESTYKVKLPLHTMPLNSKETYHLLAKGMTEGIFQLESPGMRKTLQLVEPTTFEDIIAINALYRPGPMDYIKDYAKRKKGASYASIDVLRPFLEETHGIIVFQEQILKIVQVFAGYTLAEADLLRRAISKKNRDVFEEQEKQFIKGALAQGHSVEIAKDVFAVILKFAEYGFPKSHSTAYSFITYQLAYLKANYPAHFYAELINQVRGDSQKIKKIIDEMENRRIPFQLPIYPCARYEAYAEKGTVFLGYNIIKKVGKPQLANFLKLPIQQDLFALLQNIGGQFDKQMFKNMIAAGVFDAAFKQDRQTLLASLDMAEQQFTLGFDLDFASPEYERGEHIDVSAAEKEALGFFITAHPLTEIRNSVKVTHKLSTIKEGESGNVLGIITRVHKVKTKDNKSMAFVTIVDEQTEMSVTVFPTLFTQIEEDLVENKIVWVQGTCEERNNKRGLKATQLYLK